ncbi:hypothetical protein CLU79DRAFT_833503 [Phycomyces nitens]|nr:hypothetical protein CLU79DRAFT_833503 [Phycomyces nitens]
MSLFLRLPTPLTHDGCQGRINFMFSCKPSIGWNNIIPRRSTSGQSSLGDLGFFRHFMAKTIMPTVYGSCILSVMLMIISVCSTWGVYKKNISAINISWWTYYGLTVLAFFNSAGYLSIICVTKGTFVAECIKESSMKLVLSACLQRWEAALVWATIGFTYCVYRYRILHPPKLDMTQVRPGVPPSYRTDRSIIDDEGFQVVELK